METDYSIGEVFKIIYTVSRERVFSKAFIKSILASYSFVLPYKFREYVVLLEEKDRLKMLKETNGQDVNDLITKNTEDILRMQKEFYTVFGNSLLGTWKTNITNNMSLKAIFNTSGKTVPKELLILLLLYPDIDNYKKDIEIKTEKEGKITLIMSSYDPTSFVMNTFRKNSFINFCNEIAEYNTDWTFDTELLEKILELYEHKKFFSIPLQHTDLAYNVMKRATYRALHRDDFNPQEKVNALYSISGLIKMYMAIHKELSNTDDFYNFKNVNHISFANHFIINPLIYLITNKEWKNENYDNFDEKSKEIIRSIDTANLCEITFE